MASPRSRPRQYVGAASDGRAPRRRRRARGGPPSGQLRRGALRADAPRQPVPRAGHRPAAP
eukprot:3982881-Pyramimonas_sp.AAC.1